MAPTTNFTTILNTITILESILADIDQLFIYILNLRERGVYLLPRLDNDIIHANEMLKNMCTTLKNQVNMEYLRNMNNRIVAQVGHRDISSGDMPIKLQEKNDITYWDIGTITRKISLLRQKLFNIAKIMKQINTLELNEIIDRRDPLQFFKMDKKKRYAVLLTTKKLIIVDTYRNKRISIFLSHIEDISFYRSLRSKGCLIKLKEKKSIKINISPELTLLIKRRINRILKKHSEPPERYISDLRKMYVASRPNIDEIKIQVYKIMTHKISPSLETLI